VAVGLLGADGSDLPLVTIDGKDRGTTAVLELTEASQTFTLHRRQGSTDAVAAARLLGAGGARLRVHRRRAAAPVQP
jgi:hypothetical protein